MNGMVVNDKNAERLGLLTQNVYEQLLAQERKWRIDGDRVIPTYEDVAKLLEEAVNQVKKSPTAINIAIGGILVQKADNHVDIYTFIGEA